jgi:excisionase family DNA binding protein
MPKKPPVRVYTRRAAASSAKLFTVPQAADYTSMSEVTLRHWISSRRIDVVRIGRAVRIPRAALDNLIERGLVPAHRHVAVA